MDGKYCLYYEGYNENIVSEMNNIMNPYTDISLFMCCRKELLHILTKQNALSLEQYSKNNFAYTQKILETPKDKNPINIRLKEFHDKKDKILITRRCGRLGDIFMYRMIFEDIKKMFPNKQLYFACPKEYHEAAQNHPFINVIIDCYDTNDFLYHYEPSMLENVSIHKSDYWAKCCGIKLTNHKLHLNGKIGNGILVAPFSKDKERSIKNINILKNIPLIHDKPIDSLNVKICNNITEMIDYVNSFETIISVDTSILHIAAGLGKKVIGLFRNNKEALICRYYPNVKIQSLSRAEEIINSFFS